MKKIKNMKIFFKISSVTVLFVICCAQAFARPYCPNGYIHNTSSGLCVTSACSGKCTYTYDPVSHDFWAEKNPDVPDETPVLLSNVRLNYNDGTTGILKNASIGEGITGFQNQSYVFFNHPSDPSGKGTLKLPEGFDYSSYYPGISPIHTDNFGTYDLSSMKNAHLELGSSSSYNIILNDDANLSIRTYCPYDNCAPGINLVCKGNQITCRDQLTWLSRTSKSSTQITTSYYEGDDGNGNWEVWSDEGKAVYEDSSMQKPLAKYDFDGNQTGLYEYDRGGNLIKAIENGVEIYRRRIYTPAEATASVSGKNTFKIQYR